MADIKLCETVLGGVLRGVEFIYTEPGVNRPLKPEDDEKINLNKTKYRNQINKVGNAIQEIISGLSGEPRAEKRFSHGEPSEEIKKVHRKEKQPESSKSGKWKYLTFLAIVSILIIAGILVYPKLFKGSGKTNVEKSVALMPFKNLTGDVSNDFLADMHREASYQELGKISQVKPLRIVGSRTTSAMEKDRMSLSKIAREARVDYLIEGSVIRFGRPGGNYDQADPDISRRETYPGEQLFHQSHKHSFSA